MKEVKVKLTDSNYVLLENTALIRGKSIPHTIDELISEYFFREGRQKDKDIFPKIDLSKEIWKDVQGYEGIYQVSNMGRIASIRYGFKIRKLTRSTTGYLQCSFNVAKKIKHMLVHIVVANNFLSKCEDCTQVDHINSIKTDNRVENLRWVTRSENLRSNYIRGVSSYEKCKLVGKKVEVFDLKGNSLGTFPTMKSASTHFGICDGNISTICNPKKTHKTAYSKTIGIRITAKYIEEDE